MSATINSFTLINAVTNQPIKTLVAGETINLATLPTNKLNIRADVNSETTKVKFTLNGSTNTEKSAPFAWAGDVDGDYKEWTPKVGSQDLSGTAYTGNKAGNTIKCVFNVINKIVDPEPDPEPEPTPSVKPDATNTGPTGSLRVISTGITITKDGTVLENVDVRGDIRVKASNVVIRNFKATGIKFYDEAKYGSHRNLLVEYGEITDPTGGTGIVFGHGTVRFCEIHHMGSDAINVHEGAIVENNYIHHLGMNSGSHADGISGSSPDGKAVLGVVIRRNFIDMPYGVSGFRANGAIFVGKFGTKDNPMIVEDNWLRGGHYTCNSGIDGAVILYRNNLFGRGGQVGLWKTHTGEVYEPDTRVGNVWEDTGLPVPLT